jgi:negative regulator of flagellin synthesis FlgM
MQIRGPATVHGAQGVNAPHVAPPPAAVSEGVAYVRQPDELALSDVGQLVARLHEMPDIRADKVEQIKAQLANGTYDTDAKLDLALERLMDDLQP